MLLSTILIAVPLGILALVGLVYIVAPRHLPYHRTVIVKLGEEALARKLLELSATCLTGIVAVILAAMHSQPGGAVRNLIEQWHFLVLISLVPGVGLGILLQALHFPDRALLARRGSGAAILLFCATEVMLLSVGSVGGVALAGAIAALMLAYVAHGTRALGRETGAKTPWPVLAALCALFALGTALALFA